MRAIKKQIATLLTVAQSRGLSPMFTHYYRTTPLGQKVLAATSCVLLEDLTPVSRGMSVVSTKDIGDKAFGRYLSLQRAFGAAMSNNVELLMGVNGPPIIGLRVEYFKALPLSGDVLEGGYLSSIEIDRLKMKQERRGLRKSA